MATHPDYRGALVADAAVRLALDGMLDPRIIGDAVHAGGDEQLLNRVWHCVARFGTPW